MCDPALIAAILDELGYFDEKKKEDKKDEVHENNTDKDNLINSRKGEQ